VSGSGPNSTRNASSHSTRLTFAIRANPGTEPSTTPRRSFSAKSVIHTMRVACASDQIELLTIELTSRVHPAMPRL
jgi:hypothetical protein